MASMTTGLRREAKRRRLSGFVRRQNRTFSISLIVSATPVAARCEWLANASWLDNVPPTQPYPSQVGIPSYVLSFLARDLDGLPVHFSHTEPKFVGQLEDYTGRLVNLSVVITQRADHDKGVY